MFHLFFIEAKIMLFPWKNDNNVVYLLSGYYVPYFCSSAKIKWKSLTIEVGFVLLCFCLKDAKNSHQGGEEGRVVRNTECSAELPR